MSGIFVNYRSGEHSGTVEAIHRELARHFGHDQAFLDQPSIGLGERYPDVLRQQVLARDVLLVVVHPGWLDQRCPDTGVRLLDRERDWVREEIEIALAGGRQVIPVLLGEAKPPTADKLPDSIRDLALRQAHRIRHGSFGPDTERLSDRLERHVAASWSPPAEPVPRPGRRPPTWFTVVTGTLAVAMLCAPTVVSLTLAAPANGDARVTLVTLAMMSMAWMAAPLLVSAGVYSARHKLERLSRETNTWSPTRFRQYLVPIATFWLLFGVSFQVATVDQWRVWLPITVAAFFVAFAIGMHTLTRAEQREEEAEKSWPQPAPSPLSAAARFRRAVALFRARARTWDSPLSRELRDRAWWFTDHLSGATHQLRTQAARSRRQWLSEDHPWVALFYVGWVAATAGLLLAALADGLRTGTGELRLYVVLAVLIVLIALICFVTVDMLYRLRRWQLTVLADETYEHLTGTAEQLYLDGLNRTPWKHLEADDVRQLLLTTATGERSAPDELEERLLPGGSFNGAVAHAVPFLANLAHARHLTACTRQRLAVLLARIAITEHGTHRAAGSGPDPAAEARPAVTAVTPRLLARLRPDDVDDAPSLVALAAAVPSAADDNVIAALETLAAQPNHPCGPAAARALQGHTDRRATVELAAKATCHATHHREVTMIP